MTAHTPLATRGARVLSSLAIGLVAGCFCGASSFAFLDLLGRATAFRTTHDGIVWALPLAGLAMGLVYERAGRSVTAGTDLVIDRMAAGGAEIPWLMAPLVLVGTVTTHLFGGSAGREGTAVQLGATLSDFLAHRLGLGARERHAFLVAGVAGGFGSVFGTPVAGAVFALECVHARRITLGDAVPASVAALVGDFVARSMGVKHAEYSDVVLPAMTFADLGRWLAVAVAVAAAVMLFVDLTHALRKRSEGILPRLPFRMFVGGVLVVALWRIFGTSAYLGLSDELVARALVDRNLPVFAFAMKLVFTALTLGVGFVGGEVTPLFVVGATLGNVLARTLGLPLDATVAVCFASVFGVAARTPVALAVLAAELFGPAIMPYVLAVSATAGALTGSRALYESQRDASSQGEG